MSQTAFDRLPAPLQIRVRRMAEQDGLAPEQFLADLAASVLLSEHTNGDVRPERNSNNWHERSPNDLVDPVTASRRMRLSKSKLAAMRCRGDGPKFVKMGARTVFYRVRDIDKYLETCLVQSTSA